MNKLIILCWLVVAACASEPPADETARQPALDESETPPAVAPLPPMPPFPEPRSGVLNATSAGEHTIEGAWKAQVGVCDDPGTLQVLAEVPGTGTLILLRLPPADAERTGTYPIVVADSGLPPPPAAQVGVQLFRDAQGLAFQASEGEVQIYGYGANVSGRFAVTLREIQSSTLIQYTGVFAGIAVEHLSDDYCERMKSAVQQAGSEFGVH